MAVSTNVVYQLYFFPKFSTIQYNLTRLRLGLLRTQKMTPPLMMKMAAVAVPPSSGYSRYYDGTTTQDLDWTAKERGDDLVQHSGAAWKCEI